MQNLKNHIRKILNKFFYYCFCSAGWHIFIQDNRGLNRYSRMLSLSFNYHSCKHCNAFKLTYSSYYSKMHTKEKLRTLLNEILIARTEWERKQNTRKVLFEKNRNVLVCPITGNINLRFPAGYERDYFIPINEQPEDALEREMVNVRYNLFGVTREYCIPIPHPAELLAQAPDRPTLPGRL